VLHSFPYAESSKIVRMATPGHGVVSVVAKGAHRAKSKFGASIQSLSEGVATIYFKRNRDLQTLSEFDVTVDRSGLARDLRRHAGASALAELVLRCSPEDPHPQVFDILKASLDWLQDAHPEEIDVVALAGIWGAVLGLGFSPSLESCAVDGADLTDGEGLFSVAEGGLLCASCGASRKTSILPESDRLALMDFVGGRVPTDTLDERHVAAHRRLVARFIHRHVAEDREMKALDAWENQTP
jgi:DNA repair protein RecO